MEDVQIVIPTHGRAGEVETFKVFDPDMVQLCVAESQEPLYREHYPDARYLVHPDTVVGLPPKRDWIWKQLGDCFMVDDDVSYVQDFAAGPGEPTKLTSDRIYGAVQNLYRMAKELGLTCYSFVSAGNPLGYSPMKPLKLQGSLQGHCWGWNNAGTSKLWVNMSVQGMDDEWMSGLSYHHERFVLIDSRYGFALKDAHAQAGGMATFRTTEGVERDAKLIKESFGSVVVDPGGSGVRRMLGFRFRVPHIT